MNKFLTIFFLSLATLPGCTTTSAPEVGVFNGKQVTVSAKVIPGVIDSEVFVYIDDTLAVKQRSKPLGGSSQSFKGQWKGRPVTARATRIENLFSAYTQIDVFVDGQLIETLTV